MIWQHDTKMIYDAFYLNTSINALKKKSYKTIDAIGFC